MPAPQGNVPPSKYPPESQQQSGGLYMTNLLNIARWLMAQGFSRAAAAGVAGTVSGESMGNPEQMEIGGGGGAGLIQWTPASSASPIRPIITGNRQQDFNNQLVDMLNYAETNQSAAIARGGVNLQTLKQASDPTQAAIWWGMYEGPKVPGSDVRSGVATDVYNQLQGYKPNTGWAVTAAGPGGDGGGGGGGDATLTSWNPISWVEAPVKGMEWAGKQIVGATGFSTGLNALGDIAKALTGIVRAETMIYRFFLRLLRPEFW